MKKFFLTFISIVSLGTVTSCSDAEPQLYNNNKDGRLAYFTSGTSGSFYVQNVTNPEFLIEVGVTDVIDSDRVFSISVDPNSTATSDQYVINQASLVIPAGSHIGTIKVLGNYNNVSTSGSKLILKLDSVNDAEVASFDNIYELTIYQYCPFVIADFLGDWNADEVGYTVYNSTFTAGAETSLNEIIMSNIWDVNPNSETIVYFNDSNPSNFKLDFPVYTSNPLYVNQTYGQAWIDRGVGSFSACAQTVSMKFQVRVSAGFFELTEINFSRP
jgi:hypothetical protein